MPDFSFDEAWAYYHRDVLRRRYGTAAFVAVYDAAVVDWGMSSDALRERVEKKFGEPVYVGAISSDPFPEELREVDAEYEQYGAAKKGREYRRRVPMWDAYNVADELGTIESKSEYYDGCFRVDGAERRFADHDYRLLVERGAIPKETEFIAGIVFYTRSSDTNMAENV